MSEDGFEQFDRCRRAGMSVADAREWSNMYQCPECQTGNRADCTCTNREWLEPDQVGWNDLGPDPGRELRRLVAEERIRVREERAAVRLEYMRTRRQNIMNNGLNGIYHIMTRAPYRGLDTTWTLLTQTVTDVNASLRDVQDMFDREVLQQPYPTRDVGSGTNMDLGRPFLQGEL